MPTETVYGLAADAVVPAAVARVFEAKERPLFDPLIVHLAATRPRTALGGVAVLDALGSGAQRAFDVLTEALWPGPLTLILPRDAAIGELVTAGLQTVAVRMPAHPVAQRLLWAFGGPLVAPSANRFGSISPTSAGAALAELDGVVEAVIDGGPCAVGVESTILAIDPDGTLRLLRPGGVSLEQLRALVGEIRAPARAPDGIVEAPGQTSRHYAPRTPLLLLPGPLDDLDDATLRRHMGGRGPVSLLRVVGPRASALQRLQGLGIEVLEIISLSEGGDLAEAARGLFAALRRLDQGGAPRLIAEPCPSVQGLGHAITDRLRRAAAARG